MITENEKRLNAIHAAYNPLEGEETQERIYHDFPYWAAKYVRIKPKGGGAPVPFILNPPQRKLVEALEEMRLAGEPIRLILLKARQWGGSTCVQIYMVWLQLVHEKGLNSLIIAHYKIAAVEIKDMFDLMIQNYPRELLEDKADKRNGKIIENVGHSNSLVRIIPRECKIKLATAESPDASRGGDYNLVHCSEVGLWKSTRLKTPEQILRSCCSGVLYKPLTMIVYESTANGAGTFFHKEYVAAKKGVSQFNPLFVAWYEIPQYSLPFKEGEREELAERLWENRHNKNVAMSRNLTGEYLWSLWERGATLEAINWYITESLKYPDHALMAAEYPSDDVEAFAHSGTKVFDIRHVERLREDCLPPLETGEVVADALTGEHALSNIRFSADIAGSLKIWKHPQRDPWFRYRNRYLVVMDVGGRSRNADYSVIAVFDRVADRSPYPEIVAQWRGHMDFDLLAWNAVRIAAYYHNAMLVVESNTVETRCAEYQTEGDHTPYIFAMIRDYYPNLYMRRKTAEDIRMGSQGKFGFHTNVSTKPMVVSALVTAVRDRLYIERDEEALAELTTYQLLPNGSYAASHGNHDDILMTRAIGIYLINNELDKPDRIERQLDPYGRETDPDFSSGIVTSPLSLYR